MRVMELIRQKKRIFLSAPHMGNKEIEYINKAFDTNWIAPLGENVDQFERALSQRCEGRDVVALSSGTAALHLALARAGVRHGDYVLCQSFTFCASANPIVYLGATPVFIGSEAQTWNACPQAFEDAVKKLIARGRSPKAFVYVHLYGVPAKIDELNAIARKYDIVMIEDAAESLGSTYKGKQTGTFGDYGVLSFNGNKIITTSGGGALICPSREEYDKVKFLSTQAREPAPYYLHQEIGYNYRLSNICAGIGRGQMEVLDQRVAARRDVYSRYIELLRNYSEIEFLPELAENFSNRWLTTITLEKSFAEKTPVFQLLERLETLNIECRPLWNPLHLQPVFKECEYYGDRREEDLFRRGLCLPSCSSMTVLEQEDVVEALLTFAGLK